VRDLVFLVLILQICRADGAGDERRAKIILRWTFGARQTEPNRFAQPKNLEYNRNMPDYTPVRTINDIQTLHTNYPCRIEGHEIVFGEGEFGISLDECGTKDRILDLIVHLSRKRRVTSSTLHDFILLAVDHHGLPLRNA
jgi:hypothetical protein